MHLNSANLRASQILLIVNPIDLIILDQRKDPSQMTDDTCLSAVMNPASTNDMMANSFFGPSILLSNHDTVSLGLCSILILALHPLVVIPHLIIFPQRNPATLGMRNITVLNDPSP